MGNIKMKKASILLIVFLLLAVTCFSEDEANTFRTDLQGSKILINEPVTWNKHVLILAHGYREPNSPLTADFEYNNIFFKTLVNKGWMIASTSYRVNGIAYIEGLADVGILKDFIIKKYGKPDKIFLHGESMGGSITLTLSERYHLDYAGALCLDPAIREQLNFTHKPLIPVLFLSNLNEADQVKEYLDKLDKDAVMPAHWIVKRTGHLNINPLEHLEAFTALVDYTAGKPIAMTRDILIIPQDKPSVAIFKNNGLYSRITRVHPKYGNLDTQIIPADFQKLNIKKGAMFTVQFGDKKVRVLLGTTFGDVSRGEWIAFFKEDGLLKIARNFDSAVKILGCKEGDMVFITK
jgi:hypothetical protein